MTSHHSDILLPRAAWGTALAPNRLVAFVPIAFALLGVAAILFGGISAGGSGDGRASLTAIDTTTTGSIASPDRQRRALQMLDR